MKKTRHCRSIKIAILAEEPIGWKSGIHYFMTILDGYFWHGKNQDYKITAEYVYDKDITKNKLLNSNFDVLLVPGGGVGDGECLTKGFKRIPWIKKWKKNIRSFIQNGGGYVGICGGAALLTELITENPKKTFVEKLYNNSALDVSSVQSYYKDLAFPIFYPRQRWLPEKIGAASYVFSFQPGETEDGRKILSGGVPLDFKINSDHDFFNGYDQKEIRMRWWGGPGLVIPPAFKKSVSVLAWYPSEEFSMAENSKIHPWRYTGGLFGLINGLKKAVSFIRKEKIDLKQLFTYLFYFAGDWKKTNNDLDLNLKNRAAITCEIYPNEHKGRIFLCATHPEYMVWNGGCVTEVDETDYNCIGYGFHQWKSIKDFSKTGLKELTSTWWLVRRAVAWSAKVKSEDFPPIHEDDEKKDKKEKLAEDLFWDGSLKSQIENI
ncbi:MAG: hypothetical protein KGY50_01270 [Candidatus Thermoplasmatota archaeon]|nr:hypothetical protein [Candidatus Thermoplasmatota archaeon]